MRHPDPDLLALAALPAEPRSAEVTEHLADCPECREEVQAMRHTVELARIGRTDGVAPPPRVWQSILDELNEQPEAGGSPAPIEPPPSPGPVSPPQQRVPPAEVPPTQPRPSRVPPPAATPTPPTPSGEGRTQQPPEPGPSNRVTPIDSARRSRRRSFAGPIAAAVAGIVAGIGIGAGVRSPDAPPPPAAQASTPLATLQPIGSADPLAAGTVAAVPADGSQELTIQIRGVSDTLGGDYLEAWLIDPAGTRLVSLGALTRTGDGGSYQGEFTLPANLPMAQFTTVDISAERWDGDPAHSRISLLRGTMS